MALNYACSDFLEFQDALKKMRDMDDKIIYALNAALPTESFKREVNNEETCINVYKDLKLGHKQREDAIKSCILFSASKVKDLKFQRELNRDDLLLDKRFKLEQRKLRLLQSELNVEDIVKERSIKAFNERCRSYVRSSAL